MFFPFVWFTVPASPFNLSSLYLKFVYVAADLIVFIRSLIGKMLIREPYLRCSLDDIMEDPWFKGGHPSILPTPVPLVTELPLTPEEHNYVAEKLQEGNIADRATLQK